MLELSDLRLLLASFFLVSLKPKLQFLVAFVRVLEVVSILSGDGKMGMKNIRSPLCSNL